MSDRIRTGTRPPGIHAGLCSLHRFGRLMIALHDGKLLCCAIVEGDVTASEQRRRLRQVTRKPPLIAWAGAR